MLFTARMSKIIGSFLSIKYKSRNIAEQSLNTLKGSWVLGQPVAVDREAVADVR